MCILSHKERAILSLVNAFFSPFIKSFKKKKQLIPNQSLLSFELSHDPGFS